MRKYLPIISLIVLLTILIPVSLVSAAYNYSYEIRVFNNSTTSYPDGLPVLITLNNSQLNAYGYIGADGLDTEVQEGAASRDFMVDTAFLGVFIPSFLDSQTRFLNYRLGNTPEQTTFPVVTGLGGNVTFSDNETLELGDNFTVSQRLWVDTSAGTEKYLVYKSGAFETSVSDEGNITSTVWNETETTQEAGVSEKNMYASGDFRDGQRIDSFSGIITSASFKLRKSGSPTGTGTATVRSVSPDAILGTLGTIDVSTISASLTWYKFDAASVEVLTATDVRILFEYSDGTAAHYVKFSYDGSDTIGGVFTSYDPTVWTDTAGSDSNIRYEEDVWVSVTAGGVTDGLRSVNTTADGTDLKIYVDGVEKDSEGLSGLSVLNQSGGWTLASNNTASYLEYMSLSVNGTQQLWFEPNTMIAGTFLTDRAGGDNNGTIAWGVNPSSVEVTIGGLTSSVSAVSSVVVNETAPELLEAPPTIEYFPDPADVELTTMPMYDSVVEFSDAIGAPVRVGYVLLMWLTCMVVGIAGLVAIGSGWGFVAGYGFGNALALGTPVWPQFLPIAGAFVVILGLFVWGRVR